MSVQCEKKVGFSSLFTNLTFSHNDTPKPQSVINSGLCKGLIRSCHTPPRITGTDATIGRWDASLLNAHRGWLARTLPYHWGVGNTEHGASEGREVFPRDQPCRKEWRSTKRITRTLYVSITYCARAGWSNCRHT